MFTGIIEHLGKIKLIEQNQSNLIFHIEISNFASKLGESISINGTCLTVIKFDQNGFAVEAIPETLKLTNLGDLKTNDLVNLEKSLQVGSSLDGHFVMGHIDYKTTLQSKTADGQSFRYSFTQVPEYFKYIAKKGSICINGVSLTVTDSTLESFEVCLIPYTLENTNLGKLEVNNYVNIEIDILARYLNQLNLTNEIK